VEFRYWGLQSKVERFIHDYGMRRVMLRAHRQAWAWQDEWVGLTMDDIRRLERETQVLHMCVLFVMCCVPRKGTVFKDRCLGTVYYKVYN